MNRGSAGEQRLQRRHLRQSSCTKAFSSGVILPPDETQNTWLQGSWVFWFHSCFEEGITKHIQSLYQTRWGLPALQFHHPLRRVTVVNTCLINALNVSLQTACSTMPGRQHVLNQQWPFMFSLFSASSLATSNQENTNERETFSEHLLWDMVRTLQRNEPAFQL